MEVEEIERRMIKKEAAIDAEWDALRAEIERGNRPAARSRVDSLLAITAKYNNLKVMLPPGPTITMEVSIDEKEEEIDGGGFRKTVVIEARPKDEAPEHELGTAHDPGTMISDLIADEIREELTDDSTPTVDDIIADAEELLNDFPEPKPKRKRTKRAKK